MIPLTMVLRKVNFHYELSDKVTRLNHLLFMDDLKLFAKSHDQIYSLVKTVQMFSRISGWSLKLINVEQSIYIEEKLLEVQLYYYQMGS